MRNIFCVIGLAFLVACSGGGGGGNGTSDGSSLDQAKPYLSELPSDTESLNGPIILVFNERS